MEEEKGYLPLGDLLGEFQSYQKDNLPQINVYVEGSNQQFVIRKVEKSQDISRLYYLLSYYLPEEKSENGNLTKEDLLYRQMVVIMNMELKAIFCIIMRLQVHAERGRGREEGRSGGRNVFVQSRIELNEQEYKGTTISYKPEFGVGKLKLKIRNGEMGIERRRSSRSVIHLQDIFVKELFKDNNKLVMKGLLEGIIKVSKQINENIPNIFWTATKENNKVGEILKELIPDIKFGVRDLWRLDLSAFKNILNADDDNNILIKEEGGIRVEESKQIAMDWNCIVIRNNGRPSSPILSDLINNGREGGICALRASILLTNNLVGMALYNCDAYSGSSGKYLWLDRLFVENSLTGKINGEETVIAILAKMVEIANEMNAVRIEWTDDSNELANYEHLLHSLGAVNMKEINGEFLYRWDINKYHLLNEPLTAEKKEKKEKVKQEFIPKYY
uniref:Uncharacterized protein n=1 Tax=Meloidogyne incognita TaxID=6306 RepID=A0A914M168_MELIC